MTSSNELLVKDQHADLAIQFWDTCGRAPGWNARGRGRAIPLTDDERVVRMDFHARMQALQHKGIHRRRPLAV